MDVGKEKTNDPVVGGQGRARVFVAVRPAADGRYVLTATCPQGVRAAVPSPRVSERRSVA